MRGIPVHQPPPFSRPELASRAPSCLDNLRINAKGRVWEGVRMPMSHMDGASNRRHSASETGEGSPVPPHLRPCGAADFLCACVILIEPISTDARSMDMIVAEIDPEFGLWQRISPRTRRPQQARTTRRKGQQGDGSRD